MTWDYILLHVLHVAIAAAYFGAPLGAASRLRRALKVDKERFSQAINEFNRTGAISGILGILTFLSGIGLVFFKGGFKAATMGTHAGMGLVLLMIAFGFFVGKPVGQKLKAASDNGKNDCTDIAPRLIKRATIVSGVVQVLWLATLVLMFAFE